MDYLVAEIDALPKHIEVYLVMLKLISLHTVAIIINLSWYFNEQTMHSPGIHIHLFFILNRNFLYLVPHFSLCLQIRQLAQDIKELSLSNPITIYNGNSTSSGMDIFSYTTLQSLYGSMMSQLFYLLCLIKDFLFLVVFSK